MKRRFERAFSFEFWRELKVFLYMTKLHCSRTISRFSLLYVSFILYFRCLHRRLEACPTQLMEEHRPTPLSPSQVCPHLVVAYHRLEVACRPLVQEVTNTPPHTIPDLNTRSVLTIVLTISAWRRSEATFWRFFDVFWCFLTLFFTYWHFLTPSQAEVGVIR